MGVEADASRGPDLRPIIGIGGWGSLSAGSESAVEAIKFAGHGLGDDAVDRSVERLAGLIAAEGSQAFNQSGVEPHGDGLLRGVFGTHEGSLAQSDLHQQAE